MHIVQLLFLIPLVFSPMADSLRYRMICQACCTKQLTPQPRAARSLALFCHFSFLSTCTCVPSLSLVCEGLLDPIVIVIAVVVCAQRQHVHHGTWYYGMAAFFARREAGSRKNPGLYDSLLLCTLDVIKGVTKTQRGVMYFCQDV